MEVLMKSMFQTLGKNRTANKLAKKYGLRFGASRFVAGETPKALSIMRKN
jgi:proline dehydrogenase